MTGDDRNVVHTAPRRVAAGGLPVLRMPVNRTAEPSQVPPQRNRRTSSDRYAKMSSGRNALTSMFGASGSSLIFRSTATLVRA